MDSLASDLSRTLALANRFLLLQLEGTSLDGLATSHGDILVQLFARGPVSMSELSRRIGRDPSTVTALVKKLVAMGLAETRRNPDDGRSTIVGLTERGQALEGDFERISMRLTAVWSDGVSREDAEALERVIETVQGNLRAAIAEEEARQRSCES